MARLWIIADDFTGALDTGVQFAARGASVRVLPWGVPAAGSGDAEVLVVNSESRHLSPEDAYDALFRLASLARERGVPFLYKKTDSALRGNIGSELSAVMDAMGAERLTFVPAYPRLGRITRGGVHYADGLPVAESVFGRDPFEPVRSSRVEEILGETADRPVRLHAADDLSAEGPGVHVFDAASDRDLEQIALGLEEDALRLTAGCAAFASALAERLKLGTARAGTVSRPGPLLVLCGSRNPVTLRQLDAAERAGYPRIRLTGEQKTDWNAHAAENRARAAAWVRLAGERGLCMIDANDPAETAQSAAPADRGRVAAQLGQIGKTLLETGPDTALLCTGGDTLLAVMRAAGIRELAPTGELAPGVVLNRMIFREKERTLISKSGGFGEPELLCALAGDDPRKGREKMERPILGITMGDPFGNGPEISVKALSDPTVYERCRPLVVGDGESMKYAAAAVRTVSGTAAEIHPVQRVDEALFRPGVIDVLDLGLIRREDIPGDPADPRPFGVGACALGGEAAYRSVEKAIALAMAGEVDATVTNALSKEAIHLAGHRYSGHTEIYAALTHTDTYTMMLACEDLRVVHVSTHVSLREACDRVKKDRVLEVIRMADAGCRALGIEKPRIAVAGLNPHCGENGLFGSEEIREIQPAIDAALAEGICIPERKPTPPDTVFSKALGGWYDIVVAMYHDQGHIPLKVKGFVYNREEGRWDAVAGVNVTLGLPILRASVDHGTAFGHAGDGRANALSLQNAMDYAVRMAVHRK